MQVKHDAPTLTGLLQRAEHALALLHRRLPTTDTLVELELLLQEVTDGLRQVLDIPRWPEPTEDPPDMETLSEWFLDSVCEATDGCLVEHDGTCPHGHPSWFLKLGLL